MSAYNSHIPVYIVGNLMKVDYDNKAVIERRDGHELWPNRPKDLEIINLAFDTVPAKFIT
jgi:translation initiation factor 2B subunit (eIF-2B alpha/beta/delta family)